METWRNFFIVVPVCTKKGVCKMANPHFGKLTSDDAPEDFFEPGVDRGSCSTMWDLRIKDGSENRCNLSIAGYSFMSVLMPTKKAEIKKVNGLAEKAIAKQPNQDPFAYPLPNYVIAKGYSDYFRYILVRSLNAQLRNGTQPQQNTKIMYERPHFR
jgi:hypothetical protein